MTDIARRDGGAVIPVAKIWEFLGSHPAPTTGDYSEECSIRDAILALVADEAIRKHFELTPEESELLSQARARTEAWGNRGGGDIAVLKGLIGILDRIVPQPTTRSPKVNLEPDDRPPTSQQVQLESMRNALGDQQKEPE